MWTAHISKSNHLNIEALKLIVLCDLISKSCVPYAKMINYDCKLWCIYLFIYLLGANQKEHRLTDVVKRDGDQGNEWRDKCFT